MNVDHFTDEQLNKINKHLTTYAGETYNKIADRLNAMGLRKGNGSRINNKDLSAYALKLNKKRMVMRDQVANQNKDEQATELKKAFNTGFVNGFKAATELILGESK